MVLVRLCERPRARVCVRAFYAGRIDNEHNPTRQVKRVTAWVKAYYNIQ